VRVARSACEGEAEGKERTESIFGIISKSSPVGLLAGDPGTVAKS
jgi:hypothetical protein